MENIPQWVQEIEKEMRRIENGEILLTIRRGYPERMKATQFKMITQNREEKLRAKTTYEHTK